MFFDFSDIQVKDVMVQRVDMTTISVEDKYNEILEVIKKDQFFKNTSI